MPAKVVFMQPIDNHERDSCCKSLIGLELSRACKNGLYWYFDFGGENRVGTGSSWRLLRSVGDEPIIITSEDDGHQFGLPEPVDAAEWVYSRVAGRPVTAASISPKSGDLLIEFLGGISLELLQMSAGYESWSLYVRGQRYECAGGGRICKEV